MCKKLINRRITNFLFLTFCRINLTLLIQIITSQADKITEMAAIMKTAADLDEENKLKEKEAFYSLKEENAGLREIVNIANKYGSLNKESSVESKTVQTDLPID